jgi:DNA gyrase subunit B
VGGHIYIAQPPLYRVIQRKQVRYVQTHQAMMSELISLGMNGTRLTVKADSTVFAGENLQKIVDLAMQMEQPLELLERRGIDIRYLDAIYRRRKIATATLSGSLCRFRKVVYGTRRCRRLPEVAAAGHSGELPVLKRHTAALEKRLNLWSPLLLARKVAQLVDLHEIKTLNDVFAQLKDYGFFVADYTPAGLRNAEPIYPFVLERDDDRVPLTNLRDLLVELRQMGEKGLTLTRFKGLGEMNSEELWDTSMDPEKRTLLQVRMEDAAAADEIFRVLMGDAVEPRREFIEKHALDVKELDI